MEVSDTTRRLDLTTKALLYARAGIREYWVMDIAQRSLYIHRLPSPDGYAQVSVHTAEESVSLAARPGDTVRVDTLVSSRRKRGLSRYCAAAFSRSCSSSRILA